jgi:hydroxymethylpyrimidine pyrophosphatase-like HAD family hydrolase
MGHAPETLKSIADEVTGTIDGHGVIDVLQSITARDVASR